jgi:hypothetical protein
MEGWRQRRLGSKEDHSTTKGNYKTDLTLTGLLMEGLGTDRKRVGSSERYETALRTELFNDFDLANYVTVELREIIRRHPIFPARFPADFVHDVSRKEFGAHSKAQYESNIF